MKEDFANYSQSLSLKELGFDEPCFGYFNGKEIYRLGGDSTLSIDKISMYRNTYLSFKDEPLRKEEGTPVADADADGKGGMRRKKQTIRGKKKYNKRTRRH